MPVTKTAASVMIPRAAGVREDRTAIRERELGPSTILIAVSGDIDAATAPALLDEIESRARGYHQLVLDLSRIEFFGAAGYSILHRLHVSCTRASIDWVIVAGTEVERLLRVCDPDGIFPLTSNIVSAVATLTRGPHRTAHRGCLH